MKRENMNVCSWYYLIPTHELGSTKHYKVKLARSYNLKIQDSQQPQQHHQPQPSQQQILTDVNKDIIGLTKLKFFVERNEHTNDFGFTISGSCPCLVSKVDPEKDAFMKGLRPGDYIVKIHDINVSRATCESVVKLIKNCKSRLIIEIHREKSSLKVINKFNNKRNMMNDDQTAQYINHLYFNNNSMATTDTTASTASLSGVNTDFSGKSIELPQYNLKLYSLNEINATKTTATATTTSTSNDSFEFCQPNNEDDGEEEEEEEDDDNEFYSNLVPNNVEHNEIPFMDDDEYDEEQENNYVNEHFIAAAQYTQQNPKMCTSRLLIKNEARNRAPLVASNSNDFILNSKEQFI